MLCKAWLDTPHPQSKLAEGGCDERGGRKRGFRVILGVGTTDFSHLRTKQRPESTQGLG